MARAQNKKSSAIYQIKIKLLHSEPSVWRRVLVPSSVTLDKLHGIVNEVMGWTNSHLHAFALGDRRFGPRQAELDFEDERKVTLESIVDEGEKLIYDYDFGDDWRHILRIEKRLRADPRQRYPLCIGGARACPPEDCGGVASYAELLDIITDESNPQHDDMLTWLGGYFDPKGFDANRVNARLHAGHS